MKYIIELEKIEGTDLYRAKGANTMVFDEWGIKNILTPLPEPEPEVDWSKVAVDTPVLVSNDGVKWYKRYFGKYEYDEVYKNDVVHAWDNGRTSLTADGCILWEYAKLAEVEE